MHGINKDPESFTLDIHELCMELQSAPQEFERAQAAKDHSSFYVKVGRPFMIPYDNLEVRTGDDFHESSHTQGLNTSPIDVTRPLKSDMIGHDDSCKYH
ncbi:hypothetical protein MJO28_011745 [Puccinia striiformis f. sp. tritici]|uniref:Uncharacterized protein n=1 Tax=Puccinia striiformis f. sp. tritici TaxID=168172 RepID=A0ACC0E3K8_9BASI|nr:hypothetical protein MJO28_011745 [Puccinia striiformis f. sp. tritici]